MPFDRWRKRGLKKHIPKVISFGLPGRLSPKSLFLLSQVQLHHQKEDGQEPGNPSLSGTVPALGLWDWTSVSGARQVSRWRPPVHACTPGKRSLPVVTVGYTLRPPGRHLHVLSSGWALVCVQLGVPAAHRPSSLGPLLRKQRLTEPQGRNYFISGMDLSFHNVKSQRIHCDV